MHIQNNLYLPTLIGFAPQRCRIHLRVCKVQGLKSNGNSKPPDDRNNFFQPDKICEEEREDKMQDENGIQLNNRELLPIIVQKLSQSFNIFHLMPYAPSAVPTCGDEWDCEAGDASGEVGDCHEGASTDSVDQQVEDEAGGKLHRSRDEEIQKEVAACDPQPQDQALKHNGTRKPG